LKTLYCQFLKSGTSGEYEGLALLREHIHVVKAPPFKGFLSELSPEEKAKATEEQRQLFAEVVTLTQSGEYDLVIMDEAVVAYNFGILAIAEVQEFIKGRPEKVELVFTGRDAPQELIDLADYVSEIVKIKHPYDRGVKIRKGIEY